MDSPELETAAITLLMRRADGGDAEATAELMDALYGQLQHLARIRLAAETSPTLQATELVHEAWLRLQSAGEFSEVWENRRHFFSAAAESMRRILIDHARARGAQKRGGKIERVPLSDVLDLAQAPDAGVVFHLDEALDRLAQESKEAADIVKLRFFAGLSVEETAEMTSLSRATVMRKWQFARAWLYNEIFAE